MMRVLMTLFFILVLMGAWVPSAHAWGVVGMGGGVEAGGTACTELVEWNNDGSTVQSVSTTSGTEYYAGVFEAGAWASSTVTKVQLYLSSSGTVSGITYTLQLYDYGTTYTPGTKITGGSCTFSGALLPTDPSKAYVGCTFASPITLNNGTKYWIGVNRGGTLDASNYLRLIYQSTGPSLNYYLSKDSDESGTWTAVDADMYIRFKLFTGSLCTGD